MQQIIPAIVILGVAMILLSVRVLFVKGGRFRRGHACHFDPEAKKRNINKPTTKQINEEDS